MCIHVHALTYLFFLHLFQKNLKIYVGVVLVARMLLSPSNSLSPFYPSSLQQVIMGMVIFVEFPDVTAIVFEVCFKCEMGGYLI